MENVLSWASVYDYTEQSMYNVIPELPGFYNHDECNINAFEANLVFISMGSISWFFCRVVVRRGLLIVT